MDVRGAVVLAGLVWAGAGVAIAADRVETVRFPAGATATVVKGRITGRDGVDYRIDARAGQVAQLLFSPDNRGCHFNVFEPGSDTAAHIGSIAGNEFGRNLSKDGVYRVQVYLVRSVARRGETCRYELSVEITGTPGGAGAGVSDGQMRDVCRGAVARIGGVRPARVTAKGAIEPWPATGGFAIVAEIDEAATGIRSMKCIFDADRKLVDVIAPVSGGE